MQYRFERFLSNMVIFFSDLIKLLDDHPATNARNIMNHVEFFTMFFSQRVCSVLIYFTYIYLPMPHDFVPG